MGTVNVVFALVGGASGTMPAFNAEPLAAANVTSSGTSAQSAAAPVNCAVRIATDTAIYAKAGANPTATSGGDWYIPAGSSLDLFLNAGAKIAVIDA